MPPLVHPAPMGHGPGSRKTMSSSPAMASQREIDGMAGMSVAEEVPLYDYDLSVGGQALAGSLRGHDLLD